MSLAEIESPHNSEDNLQERSDPKTGSGSMYTYWAFSDSVPFQPIYPNSGASVHAQEAMRFRNRQVMFRVLMGLSVRWGLWAGRVFGAHAMVCEVCDMTLDILKTIEFEHFRARKSSRGPPCTAT